MKVNIKELGRTPNSKSSDYETSLKLLNDCEVLNNIAQNHQTAYRLSPGAKRMLVLNALDKATTAKDTALLIRVLNEIDAQEDKVNGGLQSNVTLAWAESVSDADTVKES